MLPQFHFGFKSMSGTTSSVTNYSISYIFFYIATILKSRLCLITYDRLIDIIDRLRGIRNHQLVRDYKKWLKCMCIMDTLQAP